MNKLLQQIAKLESKWEKSCGVAAEVIRKDIDRLEAKVLRLQESEYDRAVPSRFWRQSQAW